MGKRCASRRDRTRHARGNCGAARRTAALVAGALLLGCGGGDASDPPSGASGDPNPQPAFYITAEDAAGLAQKARTAGARFARSQGAGEAILILDFGAARMRHGTHGVSLEGGTFFSNEQVAAAIEAATRLLREP